MGHGDFGDSEAAAGAAERAAEAPGPPPLVDDSDAEDDGAEGAHAPRTQRVTVSVKPRGRDTVGAWRPMVGRAGAGADALESEAQGRGTLSVATSPCHAAWA